MLKDWFLNVALKTGGPSAIRGAIVGIAGWILVRNDWLSHFGIVSDVAKHTTTISWNQLSMATIAALPAIIAAIVKIFQYHGENLIGGSSNA